MHTPDLTFHLQMKIKFISLVQVILSVLVIVNLDLLLLDIPLEVRIFVEAIDF